MEAAGFKLTQTGKQVHLKSLLSPAPVQCTVYRVTVYSQRKPYHVDLVRVPQELFTPAQHAVYVGKPLINAAGLLNVKARRGGGGGGGGRSGSGGQGGRRTPPRA